MESSAALNMASEPALPRSIRRGPPITITCECGERRDLHYGERWTCEKCGRNWSTLRIPLEEYATLSSAQLRYQWIPRAAAALVVGILIALVLLGRTTAAILLAALAATAWTRFGRARWDRRYLDRIAERPSWDIDSE
jgi:hypothetical protein